MQVRNGKNPYSNEKDYLTSPSNRPTAIVRPFSCPIQYTICFLFVNADSAAFRRILRRIRGGRRPTRRMGRGLTGGRRAEGRYGRRRPRLRVEPTNRRTSAGSPSDRSSSLSLLILWLLHSVCWLCSKWSDDGLSHISSSDPVDFVSVFTDDWD